MKQIRMKAIGLTIIGSILAVTSAAYAQTENRWSNAANPAFSLAVAGGATCTFGHGHCYLTNGQQLTVWDSFTNDQEWWGTQNGWGLVENFYLDQSQLNHMCLGVKGNVTTPGQPLVVWQCNGGSDQNWSILPASYFGLNASGCFVFQTGDGQVMGVRSGNVFDGAVVVQWPPYGTDGTGSPTLDMAWCAH